MCCFWYVCWWRGKVRTVTAYYFWFKQNDFIWPYFHCCCSQYCNQTHHPFSKLDYTPESGNECEWTVLLLFLTKRLKISNNNPCLNNVMGLIHGHPLWYHKLQYGNRQKLWDMVTACYSKWARPQIELKTIRTEIKIVTL